MTTTRTAAEMDDYPCIAQMSIKRPPVLTVPILAESLPRRRPITLLCEGYLPIWQHTYGHPIKFISELVDSFKGSPFLRSDNTRFVRDCSGNHQHLGKDKSMWLFNVNVMAIKYTGRTASDGQFEFLHHFSVRMKSGLISFVHATLLLATNLPDVSTDEVVAAIESQDRTVMHRIVSTLQSRNEVAGFFLGTHSFIKEIRSNDCEFSFWRLSRMAKLVAPRVR